MSAISTPAVSVILPVYNAAAYLEESLDSLLKKQTLQNIEVIAVDDCSKDDSPAILQKRSAEDPRLKVILMKENRGTFSVRKRAVAEAGGKYILFLDPDDFFDPQTAEELYALAEKENADIIHFGIKEFVIQPDGSRKALYNWRSCGNEVIEGEREVLRDLLIRKGHFWALCFKLIRRELCTLAAEKTKDFYCVMAEDLYFYVPIAVHARKMLKIENQYYNYNTGSGITSRKILSAEQFKRTATALDALCGIRDYLQEEKILDDPEFQSAYLSLEREEILQLWHKWRSCMVDGTRGDVLPYLLEHAPDRERLMLAVFDENDYLHNNEEFLKFVKVMYRILNKVFPQNSKLRLGLKSFAKRIFRKK